MRRSKYRNKKTQLGGVRFDSSLEAARYRQLCLLEGQGLIQELKKQVHYELQEPFVDNHGVKRRGRKYIADFAYKVGDKDFVEDVKGMILPEAKFKLTLFSYKYPNIFLVISTNKGIYDTTRIVYSNSSKWRFFDPLKYAV